jgi:hypothetical protein
MSWVKIMELMKKEFGKHMELKITRGKTHDYLGIQIDFSKRGKVIMSMFNYIDELLKECPENLMKGASSTGASSHLYNVNEQAEKLDNETSVMYHRLTAKLLYLLKQTHPDLQTPLSFLTTQVKSPDVDDWKKLGRCLRLLCTMRKDPHILEADGTGVT